MTTNLAAQTVADLLEQSKKITTPEFTFQHWLKNDIEVCAVYELATGLSFPRRGNLWIGLYSELKKIKSMMLEPGTPLKTLGQFTDEYLRSRLAR